MGRAVVDDQGLTDRQWAFVRCYVRTKNATESARSVGYSHTYASAQGSKLLAIPQVRKAIDTLTLVAEQRTGITPEYVLTKLQLLAERCMSEVPVLDREGNPTGQTKIADASNANKALELLGKHLRLFADRIEVDVSDALADRLTAARARLAAREVEATVIPSHSDPGSTAIDVSPCAATVESTHKKHYHTLDGASTDGSKGCDDAQGTASEPATPADGAQP